MKIRNETVYKRHRRHLRVRQRVVGTPQKPRLCVFRSARHIYAQIVDDTEGRTLVSSSSLKLVLAEAAPAQAPSGAEEAKGTKETKETKEKGAKGKGKEKEKEKETKGKKTWTGGRKTAAAREVGRLLAEAAKEKGISAVCFDRGGYRFHGRVAALAEAARKNGLVF